MLVVVFFFRHRHKNQSCAVGVWPIGNLKTYSCISKRIRSDRSRYRSGRQQLNVFTTGQSVLLKAGLTKNTILSIRQLGIYQIIYITHLLQQWRNSKNLIFFIKYYCLVCLSFSNNMGLIYVNVVSFSVVPEGWGCF